MLLLESWNRRGGKDKKIQTVALELLPLTWNSRTPQACEFFFALSINLRPDRFSTLKVHHISRSPHHPDI